MPAPPAQPLIRPIEGFPAEQDGQRVFVVMDPTGLAYGSLTLSSPLALAIFQLMDGQHTLDQIRETFQQQFQQDLPIGRLRVNVKRGDAFQARADVRVVASGDQRIRSGNADLRGVFVADGLVGKATVIARVGGEYAFFRGDDVHQPAAFPPPPPPAAKPRQQEARKGGRFDALEQNFLLNNQRRAGQVRWLNENVIQNVQKGVEVQRAR
jgi:hypothetical protein